MKRQAIALLSFWGLTLLAAPVGAEQLEEKATQTFAAAKVKTISLANDAGDIEVHTWGKDAIEVQATKRAHGDSAEKAKEILERITFTAQLSGETLQVEGSLDKLRRLVFFREEAEIDLAIRAPARLAVSARNGSGNVRAEGRHGPLTVNNGSGDVHTQQCDGEVNLRTGSGNIDLEQVQGNLTVQTGSGDVRGRDLAGAMHFTSGSGNIDLKGIKPRQFNASAGSGDISAGLKQIDQLQELTAKTGSGDILVRTPKIASARIKLDTASGAMKCDWCGQAIPSAEGGANSFETQIGEGKTAIRLGAASGDVQLLKGGE